MSETIWGSFDGASTQYIRPYIEVSWTQNIEQNTSTVTAVLYFHRYTNNYWSYNELTNNNGHSCTFRVGNSTLTQTRPFNLQRQNPPNRVAIWSRTQTINHNADGTATVNISANGDTNVNPRTYSFGKTITLPQIPRQTEITNASVGNNLSPGVSNTLSVTLDRKHSAYTHRLEIMDGSTVLQSTTGGVVTSIGLTASTVNKMIDSMTTTTSKNFTLRVVTLNGGTVVGSKTKSFGATLNNSTTSPVISADSVSINGSGYDKTINKYVQNISKAYITFNATYGRGATYQSMVATIPNVPVSGTRSSTGVYTATSDVLTRSGTIPVTLSATNSRGQTTTKTINITVHAYERPTITKFTAERNATNQTNVNIFRSYTYSTLGGDNAPTVQVQRRTTSGTSWSTVNSSTALSANITSTGNLEGNSYVFRVVVSDSFTRNIIVEATVGTATKIMDIFEDKGIGFNKVFDATNNAFLQVRGTSYFEGDTRVTNRMFLKNHRLDETTDGAFNISAGGTDLYLRASNRRVLLTGNDVRYWSESGSSISLTHPTLINAVLEGDWSEYNTSSYGKVGYYKVGAIVYLNGMVQNDVGAANGQTIFTLPEGYRPLSTHIYSGTRGPSTVGRIDVSHSGSVVWRGGSMTSWISLGGISFITDI